MDDRRSRGAVFTPRPIAERLVAAALDGADVASVCDPAAGDGRLLSAAAARLPASVALFGADIHERAPERELRSHPGLRWARADSLRRGLGAWPTAPAGGFDVVVGNPPFRNQLERATSLSRAERDHLRELHGDVAVGYADTASLFVVAACAMAAPAGRVAMILPLSFLTARDAAPARRRVLELASLCGLWVAGERVFDDADVQVCAVVLDRGGPRRRRVDRWGGPEWRRLDPIEVDSDELRGAASWAHLAAPMLSAAPDVDLEAGAAGRLGDIVTATAGFRDQFYGLAPLVGEVEGPVAGRHDGAAPMITSGLIEPGAVRWGASPTRIAGRRWQRPAVDPTELEPASPLARWVDQRRRPKLVVATQTKVIEAAADPTGEWIPSTPVVAVHGEPAELWRALAVLLAPPVSAWAHRRLAGAALSVDAVKLSARQVLEIPIPPESRHWEAAAAMLRDAHDTAAGGCGLDAVLGAGALMSTAYGADPTVGAWWRERLDSVAMAALAERPFAGEALRPSSEGA